MSGEAPRTLRTLEKLRGREQARAQTALARALASHRARQQAHDAAVEALRAHHAQTARALSSARETDAFGLQLADAYRHGRTLEAARKRKALESARAALDEAETHLAQARRVAARSLAAHEVVQRRLTARTGETDHVDSQQ